MKKIFYLFCITQTLMISTEAIQFGQEAVKLFESINGDPNSINNHFLRANMLLNLFEFDHALEHLEIVINAIPTLSSALFNKAYILKAIGKYAQAIPLYEKVLQQEPNHTSARFGLSQCLLALGRLKEGFHEYEYRMSNPKARNFTILDLSTVSGKKIFIPQEGFNGLGDWIMLIRYAKLLKDHGAYVIAQSREELRTLFSLCPYIDEFVKHNTFSNFPRYDKAIVLFNLPLSFDTTLETIPTPIPYIYAETKLVNLWHDKLKTDPNFKIGICWAEAQKGLLPNNAPHGKRSMPLEKLAPLFAIPGASIYSLQKIDGIDQIHMLSQKLALKTFPDDFDVTNGAFMDSAAVMMNLDLVITLDTAPAHLAGALGVPVWMWLPYAAEWRWLIDRTDSPWYPTMRIFRQQHPGNWDEVVQEMAKELKKLISTHQK